MQDELLFFNGINGATGEYGLSPMSGHQLSESLRGEEPVANGNELQRRHEGQENYGLMSDVDPEDLAQAGWGAVFTPGTDPAVREALRPLLELRQEQAGERFREYTGGRGYRPGDTKDKFLRRAGGGGSGPVDPRRVPYYLLLVGGPEEIPYRFQNLLGVPHAVGRISFDTPEDYAHYAASVVAAERGEVLRERAMGFFGVQNPHDKATDLSTRNLIGPLMEKIGAQHPDYEIQSCLGEEATKANLGRLLGGERTPALLLSASHGMEFPNGDPRQLPHQGATLCQDWPGPRAWRKAVPQDFYFAGEDLARDASLLGLIQFNFSCYGGGTPRLEEYAKQAFRDHRKTLAPKPFLADLPKRMLSHPKGGALAVVAHVDRAWSYSFMAPGLGSQTSAFESVFDELLSGMPVGAAMEYFTDRYAEISTVLNSQLEDLEFPDIEVDPWDVAANWTAGNDARGYLILGDPAVRLAVGAAGEAARQGEIEAPAVIRPPVIEVPVSRPAEASHGDPVETPSVHEATSDELLGLLDRVAEGEEIALRRDGHLVARLTAESQ